jgi:multiple sugar transport system permease protein
MKVGIKESLFPFLLLSPSLFFFLIFLMYPVLNSLQLSFTNFDLSSLEPPRFIGYSNYIYAFTDSIVIDSIIRTFVFALGTCSISFFLGFLLALLLNEDLMFKKILKTISIVPYIMPASANALMWLWIFDGEYGIINYVFKKLGLISQYVVWYSLPTTAMMGVILTTCSKMTPFLMLILLAGLQQIPESLYECAKIDGANSLQRFLYITLPTMKGVISVTIVQGIIWAFKTFDVIYAQTMGGPYYSTTTLSFLVYRYSFEYLKFGYSSSLAFILTLLIFLLTILTMKLLRE